MNLTDFELEYTLSELYQLTQLEQERQLSIEEKENYLKYYEILKDNNIDIPFGVEI